MAKPLSESTVFALSLPFDTPAPEVLAALKSRGLPPISRSAIYAARKHARKREATSPSNGVAKAPRVRAPQRTAQSNGAGHSADWEKQFMEALIHLGVDRAAEILENTKRSYLEAL